MNFGSNLFNWFISNAQNLLLVGLAVFGIYLILKRETSKLIGFVIIAIVAVLLIFNTTGVKDVLLSLGNSLIGATTEG